MDITIWVITRTDSSTDGREIVQATTDYEQAVILANRWANNYKRQGYVATIDDMQQPETYDTAHVVRLYRLRNPITGGTAKIEIYGITEAEPLNDNDACNTDCSLYARGLCPYRGVDKTRCNRYHQYYPDRE